MSIILTIKDAIRANVFKNDGNINFYFNEIEKAKFPQVFLYFVNYTLDTACINTENWTKITLNCVLEYMKDRNNKAWELWAYAERLNKALKGFEIYDAKTSARNVQAILVEDRLQMTFTLELHVKDIDTTALMQELEFTIK